MNEAHGLSFSGALNYETIVEQLSQLRRAQSMMQGSCFQINLSQVTLCDSAGLALLIEAKRWAYLHKKKLVISGMPESIEALAEFCGVLTLLMVD